MGRRGCLFWGALTALANTRGHVLLRPQLRFGLDGSRCQGRRDHKEGMGARSRERGNVPDAPREGVHCSHRLRLA